jgi:CRP/FNR family transcriptional regulator, cyclic AMP receptor protein
MGKIDSGMSSVILVRGMASPSRKKTASLDRRGIELLKNVPLFSGLSRRDLRSLAGLAEQVRFGSGRTVVQYGSRGNTFFVITEGKARVMVGYSNRVMARLGPGDFFGELALLDGGPRTASVIAETPLVTIRIARTEFRKMLTSHPDVALKMLEELSSRLRAERSATD